MNRTISTLVIAISFFSVHAQIDMPDCNASYFDSLFAPVLTANYYHNFTSQNKDDFIDDWRVGEVVYANGVVFENKTLRYNGVIDELVWMRLNDYQTGIVYKEKIDRFILYKSSTQNSRTFIKTNLPIWLTGSGGDVYLELLSTEGQYTFYCFRKMKKNATEGETYEKFMYFVSVLGDYKKIRLGKKQLLSLIDKNDQQQIKKLFRQSKLNLHKENDMSTAVDLVNGFYKQLQISQ